MADYTGIKTEYLQDLQDIINSVCIQLYGYEYNIIKHKIVVKDLDNLRDEFIKVFYGNKSWTYIDENEYQNDEYLKKSRQFVYRYMIDNPENIRGYERLIDKAMNSKI